MFPQVLQMPTCGGSMCGGGNWAVLVASLPLPGPLPVYKSGPQVLSPPVKKASLGILGPIQDQTQLAPGPGWTNV